MLSSFYKAAFGGEFTAISRFGHQDWGMPVDENEKNNYHARGFADRRHDTYGQ